MSSTCEETLATTIQNYLEKQNKYTSILFMSFLFSLLTLAILYSVAPKIPFFIHLLLFFLFFAFYFWICLFMVFRNIDKKVLNHALEKCVIDDMKMEEKKMHDEKMKRLDTLQQLSDKKLTVEKMLGGPIPSQQKFYRDQDIPSTMYIPTIPIAQNDRDFNNGVTTPTNLNEPRDNYCFVGAEHEAQCSPVCSGSPIPSACQNVYYAIPGPQWQPPSASSMQKQMHEGKWTPSTCPINR